MSKSLLEKLLWRRALKRFKVSENLPEIDINPILEAARLAPGSYGIQPFNIHVVTNQEIKSKLAEVSYNQPQVIECTHLLVFSALSNPQKTLDRFISYHTIEKVTPNYFNSIKENFLPMDRKQFLEFATNQTFIALGFSLTAAADLQIATCPMSGFIASEVHKVLELDADELPVAYLAVGYLHDNNEESNPYPKLNLNLENLVKYYK